MALQILSLIQERARKNKKKIGLADAEDIRMVQAARNATDLEIAEITLIGDAHRILEVATTANISLNGITIADPSEQPRLGELSKKYSASRAGLAQSDARSELITNPLLFAAMLASIGEIDGVLAGSLSTTGNVIRAAIRGIGLAPDVAIVSSMFLMCFAPITGHRKDEIVYGFGDCAVIPDPSSAQLADIAVSTAQTYSSLTNQNPVTAMLSFSTKGSAHTASTEKVIAATALAKTKAPALTIDGELQFDAAIVAAIGERKAPGSPVGGRANVFIFPNLDAGNIGYKIAERLGMGEAIGPILQGLAKPMNDLSRGATVSDIINMIAITALQAQTA